MCARVSSLEIFSLVRFSTNLLISVYRKTTKYLKLWAAHDGNMECIAGQGAQNGVNQGRDMWAH